MPPSPTFRGPSPVALRDLIPPPLSWSDLTAAQQSKYCRQLRLLKACALDERDYNQTLLGLAEDLLHSNVNDVPLAGGLMFRTRMGPSYWNAVPGFERRVESAANGHETTASPIVPTLFQDVTTQLALANLLRAGKGQPALPIPFTAAAGQERGKLGMYLPDLDQHIRWGFERGSPGHLIMTWVCELKIVGISYDTDGKPLPDRNLTHDRDWSDSRTRDQLTESGGSETNVSTHPGESEEDRWLRLFRRQLSKQWAAGTAKLVTYLLSVQEFCGAYCGSTIIHNLTAGFVVVNEEPLTIAVECTQEVLDKLDGVLLMSDFISDRDNAAHMPTSLVSDDFRAFDADGLARLLDFIHAARSVWSPMTDTEATATSDAFQLRALTVFRSSMTSGGGQTASSMSRTTVPTRTTSRGTPVRDWGQTRSLRHKLPIGPEQQTTTARAEVGLE